MTNTSHVSVASQPFANLLRSHLCAADGGARLLGDYETEQLCAKLTLGELQGLCTSLAADGVDREQMIALLQAWHNTWQQCPHRRDQCLPTLRTNSPARFSRCSVIHQSSWTGSDAAVMRHC